MKRLYSCLVLAAALTLCSCGCAAAGTEILNEGVVDASSADVWKALTTREGAESWMVAKADIDLRLGGLMRTHYNKDGVLGDDGTIENMFLSFDPERMYSIRIAKPPVRFPFKNAWKSVWSVVYLDPVGADKTKVSIRMLGFAEDEEAQKMREFFLKGNQYVLDLLVAKFKKTTTVK